MIAKNYFIKEAKDGDRFDDVFILESIQEKLTKSNKPYLIVTLRDKSGSVSGKVWDVPDEPLKPKTYVKVRVDVGTYAGSLDFNVKKIRPLGEGETVEPGDFLTVGPNDRRVVWERVRSKVQNIEHHGLRHLCQHAMDDAGLAAKLIDAPAAKSMHHNYVGGLIDHVHSLMGLADYVCHHYKYDKATRDLLEAAALFHDIGKIDELTWDMGLGYSLAGSLIGHVSMGLLMIGQMEQWYWRAIEYHGPSETDLKNNQNILLHLKHIVASHHGRLEWGAAKTPMSREAQLFHLMDMIDSRMAMYDNVVQEPTDEDGLTGWLKSVDGFAWVPKA